MAQVILEYTDELRAAIEAADRRAAGFADALADGLEAAAGAGADGVAEQLVTGGLGLTMQKPGQGGLAGSVTGWMIDRSGPLAAVGVPANSPAAAYAAIHEFGGQIRPVRGRALAIPVSDEARLFESPRMMAGLVMIKRPGRNPILARPIPGTDRIEVHWVLVGGVTIRPTAWLSRGVQNALPDMVSAMEAVVWRRLGGDN